jgi:hypothetical protein
MRRLFAMLRVSRPRARGLALPLLVASLTAVPPAVPHAARAQTLPLTAGDGAPAPPEPEGDLRMEILLRRASALEVDRMEAAMEPTAALSSDKSQRLQNGFLSLLVPGLGQFRSGHTTRGAIFAGIEAAVWTSYLVFDVQGHSRRNAYEDYAVQFAGVQGTDRNDDYWRAVASYRSSDEYNEQVRRALRAGVEPPGPALPAQDGWRWQNERVFDNYQGQRKDSNSAFDNAKLVTLLALVNHAAAFVDAVRSGVAQKTRMETSVAGMDLKFTVKPSLRGSSATLSLQRQF